MLKADKEELYKAFYAESIVLNIHYKPVYKHSYYQKMGKDSFQNNFERGPYRLAQ